MKATTGDGTERGKSGLVAPAGEGVVIVWSTREETTGKAAALSRARLVMTSAYRYIEFMTNEEEFSIGIDDITAEEPWCCGELRLDEGRDKAFEKRRMEMKEEGGEARMF